MIWKCVYLHGNFRKCVAVITRFKKWPGVVFEGVGARCDVETSTHTKQSTQSWLISHAGWDIFWSFLRFFFHESIPGRHGVVQDCGNVKNDEMGISIHNSPASGSVRLKRKSFVSMQRKNFNPVGKFAVCSEHLTRDCFTLAFTMKEWIGIWRRRRFQPFGKNPLKDYQSGVDDQWVELQCICAVLITIIFNFLIYLWHNFFWHCCSLYSGNGCYHYLDFPYSYMCFHTFLLSSHS